MGYILQSIFFPTFTNRIQRSVLYFVPVLLLFSLYHAGAVEVTIGTGTIVDKHFPLEALYNYSYTQQIYLQSEIANSGDITDISFYWNGNGARTRTIVIYMCHTTKTGFTSVSDWISSANFTQVYSGTYSLTATAGWHKITLDSPFSYNNSDNLCIAFDDNTGSYVSSSDDFYHTSTSADGIYNFRDAGDILHSNPGTSGTYGYTGYRANIKLTLSEESGIIIGTGTSTANHHVPTDCYYDYVYTQQIYLQSEIDAAQPVYIDSIAFYWNGNGARNRTVVVYMANTSKSTFSSATDYLASSSLTQVFSGTYSLTTTAGWHTIVLDNSFYYNNSDNLLIAFDDNTNSWTSSADEFYCTSGSGNRSIAYWQDNSDILPSSPSATNSGFGTTRANLKLKTSPASTLTAPVAGAGECLSFDGSGDYVNINSGTGVTGSTGWTLEFWIMPNSPTTGEYERIFIQGASANASRQLEAVYYNGEIEFYTSTTATAGSAQIASGTITDDGSTWIHVAWTFDGTSTHNVYVNGISSTGTVNSSNLGVSGGMYIGCYNGNDKYWTGSLDNVRLWSDVRTTTELQTYMYETLDTTSSDADNLILDFRFDEGAGGLAVDYSDIRTDGTITNATRTDSEAWKNRSTDEDSPFTFFAGYDPNGGAVILTQTVAPLQGALIFDHTNVDIIYVPDINASGADNFTFQISDGSETDTYAMTVTTTNVNMSPVAGSGNCLNFDGALGTDYVMVPYSSTLQPAGAVTLEFWAYDDNWTTMASLNESIVSNMQTGGYAIFRNTSSLNGRVRRNGAYSDLSYSLNSLTSGWHHFALVYDGRYAKLYIDGVERDSDDAGGSYAITYSYSNALIIGGEATAGETANNYFQGDIDEVRVWSDARTAAEIANNIHKALDGSEANLVGYWRLDEGSGDVVRDWSGDDNHGLLRTMESTDWIASEAWKNMVTAVNVDTTHGGGYDPEGAAITLSTSVAPSSGTLTYNNTNRTVNYDPATDATGTYTYTYQISDGSSSDTYAMSIEVIGGENYNNWTYNQNLYLNTTASGANISGNVTNFPLCVRLDTTNFRFGQAESDGTDIRFAKSDGTHLYFEREQWALSASDSVAVFWVLLDTVYGNNSVQYIKMYWGNNNAVDSSVSTNVFKTGAGYDFAGVWHLGASYTDATSNNNHGASSGSSDAECILGKGESFDGTNDYISVTDAASLDISSQITLSAWINADEWETNEYEGSIICKDGGTPSDLGYALRTGDNGNVNMVIGNNSWPQATSPAEMNASAWYYLTGTYDGSAIRVYIDGVLKDTETTAIGIGTNTYDVNIGKSPGFTARYFNGKIEEARISNTARSPDWIKLCYENQRLAQTVIEHEDYSNWNYSTSFTINTSTTGAGVSSDVTDFPLLIRLDTSNFVFADAQPNGSDIRFERSNGKHLYYEIERWDSGEEEAEIWVRVDSIYGDNNSQFIKMHFGNSGVLNRSRGDRVFDVSEGFAATWHMAEDPSGGDNAIKDKTWNANNGTSKGTMLTEDLVDGNIGKGIDFDGTDDFIGVPDQTSLRMMKNMSISAWIDWTTNGTYNYILEKGNSDDDNYGLLINNSTTKMAFEFQDSTSTYRSIDDATGTVSTTGMQHITVVFDGANDELFFYINGSETSSPATTYDLKGDQTDSLRLGRQHFTTNNFWFDGIMDEVRISHSARSADWVKLCYETQRADQGAVVADAVELLPLTIHHNIGSARGPNDTLEVITDQWKIIFDENNGGGIKWLSNEATGTGANQLDGNTNLFYLKADGNVSWNVPGRLTLLDTNSLYCNVLQEFTINSHDWDFEYTIYGNGRMYVRVSTEALHQAYAPSGGLSFRLRSDVTNRGYYTQTASASTANYMLHSDRASSRFDLLLGLFEDWATADSFTSTSTNDWFGITDGGWQLSAGQKEVWEFLVDFGHKKWNDTAGVGKHVDDYRDIDSLKFNLGRSRMEKAWEERLIGHWTFDEGSSGSSDGATVGDSAGTGHTGTVEGGTWGDGYWRNGVVFNGNDSVAISSASAFDNPWEFTITAWIKKSGTGESDDMIFGKFNPTAGEGYKFYCDANKLKASVYDISLTGATSLGTGWRHVAISSNQHKGYTKLFVDGMPDAIYLGQATVKASAISASIGNSFNGTLDDVRFFNKEISEETIRALAQDNFRVNNGMYMIRAENNNTVDLKIDGTAAIPERFPIFQIANYWATTTPKAVYYNGNWQSSPKGFIATLNNEHNILTIGFNKKVTISDQRIYIDDTDSTGAYMVGPMPTMTYGASGSDYYVKNTSSSSFGAAGSNEFYLYWKMSNSGSAGMGGELTQFKSSETEPSEAISSADNMLPTDTAYGTFGYTDYNYNSTYSSSMKHVSLTPSYTVLESSDVRVRLQIDDRTIDGPQFDYDLSTIWTIYPTGQVFRYDKIDNMTQDFDYEFVRFRTIYEAALTYDSSKTDYRCVLWGGTNVHDFVLALLSTGDKNGSLQLFTGYNNVAYQGDANYMGFKFDGSDNRAAANAPYEYTYYIDIQHNNMGSEYMDSVCKAVQNIANTSGDMIIGDLVDTTTGDIDSNGFNDAEGAYVMRASNNTVHFNLDADGATDGCRFYPAFRIINYTALGKPRFVKMYTTSDTIVLLEDYTYNCYLNTTANELIVQLDTVLCNDVNIYLDYDDDLAVTMSNFYAIPGDGNDTLFWRTESESQNLGFFLYRRIAPRFYDSLQNTIDTSNPEPELEGAGLLLKRGALPVTDTLWVPVNREIIPGADGGTSVGPLEYSIIDYGVHNNVLYEYKLEMVDMNLNRGEYGPISVMPIPILPKQFMLFHNFPNPVKYYTFIKFDLPEKTPVSLNIYNLQGRLITQLIKSGKQWKPGYYKIRWDAKNEYGLPLASGPYIYRLVAGKRYAKSRLMIVVK